MVIEGRGFIGNGERSDAPRRRSRQRTHRGQSVAARASGVLLLADSQNTDGRRRRRLVARSGRRLRRTVATRRHQHVLGRHAADSSRTTARTRCIATRRPAFSATVDSSGRATCRIAWETLKTARAASASTAGSRVCRCGARTSAAFIRHRRVHGRAVTCGGFSSRRSIRCFVRTAATGTCICRGVGMAATAARTRRANFTPDPAELTQRAG